MIESAVTDLPQPDSPTMPERLARLDREADAVDRADDALAREEVRAQVVDLEQRPCLRLPRPRVEGVAEAVGDEVRAEDERRDRDRRDDDDVRVDAVDARGRPAPSSPTTRPAG